MRRRLFFLPASLCLAASALGAERPFRFDDLSRLERLTAFSLSADGKWLAYAVMIPDVSENTSRSALWLKPAGVGQARRLTSGRHEDTAPSFSPDGRMLAFLSNREGSQQVWTLDLSGGEPRRATSFPNDIAAFQWSPDGRWFVFTSDTFPDCSDTACLEKRLKDREKSKIKARIAERLLYRHWDSWKDGMRKHIWKVPVAGGAAADLTPGDRDAPAYGGDHDFQVSPDGRELVYTSNPDQVEAISTNGDVWVRPFDGSGPAVNLTAGNKAFDGTPRFSPDGRWIAYRAQKRPGFEADRFELVLYDRASRKARSLTAGFDNWVDEFEWAADSKSIYLVSHVAARGNIYRVAVSGGPIQEVWKGGAATLVRAAPDGRRLYFSASSLTEPADLWSLGADGKGAQAETRLNEALLSEAVRGKVLERWVPSADGRKLQGWLLLPPGFDASKSYPALLVVHGGPQTPLADAWSYRWNLAGFAGYGYVVYAPNPRGSPGFGQKFVDEISQDWGGKVYDDLMRQADDLESLPYVDKKRIGAAGASYGGYMIAWFAGHTTRFAALICHDGTFDLRSAKLATEELWFPNWEFGGMPWESDLYEKWNPFRFADKFRTPTLVITNEKDYRVPFEQGLQFFTVLQVRGVPSKLLMFPDEGHWVLKPGNALFWHNVMVDWLAKWLGGAPADERVLARAYSVTR
ncbi:MAG: S9 family peptidase [Thermoanaerobaculia bacterium]